MDPAGRLHLIGSIPLDNSEQVFRALATELGPFLSSMPDGETGELVMTTLRREGMPILRYRTRDLTRILPGPCACGRQHRRIDRIAGRADDMLIVKGVNIYPMQIEKVLMTFAEIGKNYQIVLEQDGVVERIRVRAAVIEEVLRGSSGALDALRRRITAALHDDILVTPVVELVAEAEVPRAEGKAKRVVDLRQH